MYKILTIKEYNELINKINELVEENGTIKKQIKGINEKISPKYFGGK